ncbi:hypothetical protein [Stutzerimonas nitrititolerans]|uniref:hypothetical protein n=1 Tax=Stutzerimonas nitrititolerans TaxID=2482751 RepID=UPI00289DF8BF|nr:hypothetical protein [Stutzerimonas nitrititolerans]
MDSTLIAGILGAAATIAAVVIGWYLQRPKALPAPKEETPNKIEQSSTTNETADSYTQRYLEYPSHYRFIKGLPKIYLAVRENAQEGWDTGVTADMRQASYDVINFLEYAWLRLAEFYPEKHWNGKSAKDHIRNYLQERFAFHWSKYEPNGQGTGGTIVGVLTGGDVISDLEGLINDTVSSLFMYNDDFDFNAWREAWKAACS